MSAYPTEALPFLAAQLLFDVAQMKRTAKQRLFGMEDLREARSRLRENLSNERDIRIRTRQKLAEANQKLIGAKLARKKGAATMLANSAKQTDKTFVRECWEEWQTTPLDRDGKKKYAGKAWFAKDMLTKCESLKSAAVISRWCLSWEKENITRPA